MSGNVSNHVWVEDATKPLGGYWVREKGTADGATLVSDAPLNYIPYSDATYTYYCTAPAGTALATAGWQIARKYSSGRIEYAGTGGFAYAATDLATVQGAFA